MNEKTIDTMNVRGRSDIYFTSGQVARLCQVSPRTVGKWFDSGRLNGFKVPGSKQRRIPASDLLAFLKKYDMPTEALEAQINAGRVELAAACREFRTKVASDPLEFSSSYKIMDLFDQVVMTKI
jgi:excisionase family DNA binding protein